MKKKVNKKPRVEPTIIPERLKSLNFVLDNGKVPIEKAWQKKEHRIDDQLLINHLNNGKNYGVRGGETSSIVIDDKSYFLVIVDFDNVRVQEEVLPKLPETFTAKSGGKGLLHLYFATDDDQSYAIKDENKVTLVDVINEGKQIIGPGSVHADTGNKYEVVKDIPFAYIPYAELKAILSPYDKSPKKEIKPKKEYITKNPDDISNKIFSVVSMKSILEELGVNTSLNPTGCPFHSSSGGKCMGWSDETCHCFHCDGSWNKYSIIREAKKLTDKQTFEWFAEKAGMMDELSESRKKFKKTKKREEEEEEEKNLTKLSPIYYDKVGIWWIWNKVEKSWEMVDEVDILNAVQKETGAEIIKPKNRTLILNTLKQKGRKEKPLELPRNWIQFKNKIVDISTEKEFEPSPEYFGTNPLAYNLGDEENTPTIDKLFNEWVVNDGIQDGSYVTTLYEVIAYSMCKEQFLQRIIALTGSGSNGKGTFLNLLEKFIGSKNCCSSNLKAFANRNFESSAIYKKLICFFGEVSSSDLTNTNLIKSLTGEDMIRFEFKGRTPFSEKSETTPIIATNALPITPDKSVGFYRRWLIIDFPHQFPIKRDLLKSIPEQEFENLGRKLIRILKELYKKSEFTNSGSIEERTHRYELRSNPIVNFINDYYEVEGIGKTRLREFALSFNKYLKSKRLMPLTIANIGKLLREDGFEIQARDFEEGDKAKAIIGLEKKEFSQKKKVTLLHHKTKDGSFGSYLDKTQEKLPELPISDIWNNKNQRGPELIVKVNKSEKLPELPISDIRPQSNENNDIENNLKGGTE